MPELPEIETICRTLRARMVGRRVVAVAVQRADVVRGACTDTALGEGQAVNSVERHGKQLAVVMEGGCVCMHLGMSGSLRFTDINTPPSRANHEHVAWRLSGGGSLVFRDPRRFGGIWTFASEQQLRRERWARLGPDALIIAPGQLCSRLERTTRPLKSALLDQTVLAGLGNIYVDELLYAAKLHPLTRSCELELYAVKRLVWAMRRLLAQAIDVGGSTLRDYVDAEGRSGKFQDSHRVYGRMGQPCRRCGHYLTGTKVAGRTTTYCPECQVAT